MNLLGPQPKHLSKEWVKGAFSLTSPVVWHLDLVCIDKCEDCPLYQNGCGAKCVRWGDLVCNTCTCLGSSYADIFGKPETVNPKTNEDAPEDPALAVIRARRKQLRDGEECDVDARVSRPDSAGGK